MSLKMIADLQNKVATVAPINRITVGTFGQPETVDIDFRKEATPEQKSAAQAVVAAFDWSRNPADDKEAAKKRTKDKDPHSLMSRAYARVAWKHRNEIVRAVNKLLPPRDEMPEQTWQQYLAAVRKEVDDETDPEA